MIRTTPALMERVGLPNWLINEDPFEASFRPDTEIMSAQQSDTYLNEIVIAKSIKQLARSIQGNRKTKRRRQHNPLPDFLHPNCVVHMCVFDCDPIREVTESFWDFVQTKEEYMELVFQDNHCITFVVGSDSIRMSLNELDTPFKLCVCGELWNRV